MSFIAIVFQRFTNTTGSRLQELSWYWFSFTTDVHTCCLATISAFPLRTFCSPIDLLFIRWSKLRTLCWYTLTELPSSCSELESTSTRFLLMYSHKFSCLGISMASRYSCVFARLFNRSLMNIRPLLTCQCGLTHNFFFMPFHLCVDGVFGISNVYIPTKATDSI